MVTQFKLLSSKPEKAEKPHLLAQLHALDSYHSFLGPAGEHLLAAVARSWALVEQNFAFLWILGPSINTTRSLLMVFQQEPRQ